MSRQQSSGVLNTKCPLISDLTYLQGSSTQLGGDIPSNVEPSDPRRAIKVVEFWATWCPPCRQSIPHLNKIHEKYKTDRKNVVVVGITNEDDEKRVRSFINSPSTRISYSVALDSSFQAYKHLVDRSGSRGIPTAFILSPDNVVKWVGHPLDPQFERTLDQLVQSCDVNLSKSDQKENVGGKQYGKKVRMSVSQVKGLNAGELRKILNKCGVDCTGCLEKQEFVDLALKNCIDVVEE
ncbi:thioredoxin-like protein [Paraphysoderma sedebokerense]|nr:thioredoxin-like protein [Paraphysoderma sedebokerense]